jgi:hypothetical protein
MEMTEHEEYQQIQDNVNMLVRELFVGEKKVLAKCKIYVKR